MHDLHLVYTDLEPSLGNAETDLFTIRILQLKLATFWREHSPVVVSTYDPITAQQSYETFCTEFLPAVPAIFALQPDTRWDEHRPLIPRQRQLFHVAIFEWFCYKFRPILFEERRHIGNLPGYKQVLIMTQKRGLAASALFQLEAVASLHRMMGGSHTRFPGVIAPTFEAAVLLLCLCADQNFPEYENKVTEDVNLEKEQAHPLEIRQARVTRAECMHAARAALARLQTLAVISGMAEVGARNLARLLENLELTNSLSGASGHSTVAFESAVQLQDAWSHLEVSGNNELDNLSGVMPSVESSALLNWDDLATSWAGSVHLS